VRCRTSGCKKTWTWTRSDQLDACLAGKPAPKVVVAIARELVGFIWAIARMVEPKFA